MAGSVFADCPRSYANWAANGPMPFGLLLILNRKDVIDYVPTDVRVRRRVNYSVAVL